MLCLWLGERSRDCIVSDRPAHLSVAKPTSVQTRCTSNATLAWDGQEFREFRGHDGVRTFMEGASGFSGRTWNSSIGSNPTTAGTSLSTVAEASMVPQIPTLQSKAPLGINPPPAQALPPPPNPGVQPLSNISTLQGVRSRRLSGQNLKQLKIETTTKASSGPAAPLIQPPSMPPPRIQMGNVGVQPKTASLASQQRQVLSAIPSRPPVPQSTRQASSPFPGPSSEIISPPTPTDPDFQ